jgi:hypothetical protein
MQAIPGWLPEALIAFGSAVFGALAGTWGTLVVQRRDEARKRREAALRMVYMHMLSVKAEYFWIASAEMHNRPFPRDVAERSAERG